MVSWDDVWYGQMVQAAASFGLFPLIEINFLWTACAKCVESGLFIPIDLKQGEQHV